MHFEVWIHNEDKQEVREYKGESLKDALSCAWKFLGDYAPEIRVVVAGHAREVLGREHFDESYNP